MLNYYTISLYLPNNGYCLQWHNSSRLLGAFFADTSRPVITFDKPSPRTPQQELSVTWKSSEVADFECALEAAVDYEPCGKGRTGSFQRDDLPDGKHKLYVRGTDEVGNVGEPSVYTVITGRGCRNSETAGGTFRCRLCSKGGCRKHVEFYTRRVIAEVHVLCSSGILLR